METAIEEKEVVAGDGKETGKRKWWNAFLNFLMMGGFLLLLIVGVAIAVLISLLFK